MFGAKKMIVEFNGGKSTRVRGVFILILQGAETIVFFFQTRMERVLVRDELSLNIVFKACYQRLPKVL